MSVVEANNEIKELRVKEKAEIERILAELTGEVVGVLPGLKSNIELLTAIDFAFAKAKLSIDMKGTSPALNSRGEIVITRQAPSAGPENRCPDQPLDRKGL